MNRWGIISLAAFLAPGALGGFWSRPAFGQVKAPAQLEAEYEREPNPKRRVRLAVDLMEERLKLVRAAYAAEDSGSGSEAVENYLSAVERLEKALKEAPKAGDSKDAEIHLRRQTLALENLKMTVSFNQRAPVEKALARVTKLHEEILYTIMKPHKKAAGQ